MKIREISRITGVSPATVSRMIRNPDSVKKNTQDKIYAILKEKNCEFLLSRSIVNKIVVVIPELTNNFYMDICRGVIMKAQENKIPCEIFLSFESQEKEKEIFERLKNYQRTGVIWSPSIDQYDITKLEECIILNIDREIKDTDIKLKILCDDLKASEQITEFLFQKGAKNPALITGNFNLTNAMRRATGFKNMLQRYKISDPDSHIYYGDFNDAHSGYAIAKDILSHKAYDGILAGNYILAIGIIKAIKELHMNLKKDIQVATFNQLPNEEMLNYPIIEAIFPTFEMGQEAVDLLLKQSSYNPETQISNFRPNFFLR
ncbi:MAG: LacI family DNA-binding transcriptional regulator [Brevinema sp.]